MADELSALSLTPQATSAEADYDTLCSALMTSARGRWFLQEYARRNRHAETEGLLAALARIESVIRHDRAELADQGLRNDLLDMARTVAQARAEVAEIKPDSPESGQDAALSALPDALVAAERLQDLAWTLRERGLELATCDEIEAIARTVLSGPSLRNPGDQRVQKLGEALDYLARRLDAVLEQPATGAPSAAEPVSGKGREPKCDAIEIGATQVLAQPAAINAVINQEEILMLAADSDAPGLTDDTPAPTADDEPSSSDANVVVVAAVVLPAAEPATDMAGDSVSPQVEPESAPVPASVSTLAGHDDNPPPSLRGASNPLAALEAMSDEERLALFT
jgi:chemotaxis protein CheZ